MLRKKIFLYLACFLFFLSVPNVLGAAFVKGALTSGSPLIVKDDGLLRWKTVFFKKLKEHLDCVFIGDSRTYQAIDPQIVDYFLKTKSYNFAGGAHWFDTQYAQLSDVLPQLMPGTTVVWSICHTNFESPYKFIPMSYPLSPRLALEYLALGFRWNEVKMNALTYNVLIPYGDKIPGFYIYNRRSYFYDKTTNFLSCPVTPSVPVFSPAQTPLAQTPKQLKNWTRFKEISTAMKRNKSVEKVSAVFDNGEFTAALIYKYNGVLLLAEIESEIYRKSQMAKERLPEPGSEFEPDPRYLKLFDKILDLFEKYPVRLVVNEFEFAPYAYGSPENREKYRAFMRKIRSRVEKRNIPYIGADHPWLKDRDFYDNCHLNHDGAMKYSAALASKLKAAIK